jgi:hypothetical protein
MKKYKKHIISILLILIMLIFALSTSYGVSTEVIVKNNSSQDLRLKITRYEEYDYNDYSEEFTLKKKQSMRLRTIHTRNKWPNPDKYIKSIIIYNENGDLLKEYNKINEEDFSYLFDFTGDPRNKNNRNFSLVITDEILK